MDFGCGPLTSAVSLAWHYLVERPKAKEGVLVHYLGIDRSAAMIAHAKEAPGIAGIFHRNSTFEFMTQAQSLKTVPQQIGQYRSALSEKGLTVVLNFSYLFASRQFQVAGLITFVSTLLKDYLGSDKVCLVFQNPDNDALNGNWKRFKSSLKELQELSWNSETICFLDLAGQERKIRLRHEFLLNRKWMDSDDIIPF